LASIRDSKDTLHIDNKQYFHNQLYVHLSAARNIDQRARPKRLLSLDFLVRVFVVLLINHVAEGFLRLELSSSCSSDYEEPVSRMLIFFVSCFIRPSRVDLTASVLTTILLSCWLSAVVLCNEQPSVSTTSYWAATMLDPNPFGCRISHNTVSLRSENLLCALIPRH
jgi:hypothetical protein